MNLNHHNLLNINTNANVKNTKKGGKTISSPDLAVGTTGHKLIAKVFNLNGSTNSNENLATALKTIVNEAGSGILLKNTDDAGTILEDVGQYIFDKQASASKELSQEDVTMLQNLSIVLKVARKINNDKPSTFNCFTEFNRHSRYSYKDDGGKPQVEVTSGRDGQDATSWTSFFKDALAFDAKQKGKANVGEIFKGGTPIADETQHEVLLRKFNSTTSEYKSELNQFWVHSGRSGDGPPSSVPTSRSTTDAHKNTAATTSSTPEEARLKKDLADLHKKVAQLENTVSRALPTPQQPTRRGDQSAQIDALRSQLADLEHKLAASQRAEQSEVVRLKQQVSELMAEVEGLRGYDQERVDDGYDGDSEDVSPRSMERHTQRALHNIGLSTDYLDPPILDRRRGASRQRLRRSGNRRANEPRIRELTADYEAKLQEAIASVEDEYASSLQEMKVELEASAAANEEALQGQYQQGVAALSDQFQKKQVEMQRSFEERLAGIYETSSKQFEQFAEADQMQMEDRQSLGVELKATYDEALQQIKGSYTAALSELNQIIAAQNDVIEKQTQAINKQGAALDGQSKIIKTQGELLRTQTELLLIKEQTINDLQGNIRNLSDYCGLLLFGLVAQDQVITLGAGMVFAQMQEIQKLSTPLADQKRDIDGITYFLEHLPRDFTRFNQQFGDSLNGMPIFVSKNEQGSDVGPGQEYLVLSQALLTFLTQLRGSPADVINRMVIKQQGAFRQLVAAVEGGTFNRQDFANRLGTFHSLSAGRQNLQQMMFFLTLFHGIKTGVITPKTMQQLGITAVPQHQVPLEVLAGISNTPGVTSQRNWTKEAGHNVAKYFETLPQIQTQLILNSVPSGSQYEGLLSVWPEQGNISPLQDSRSQLGLISNVEGKYVLNSTGKAVLERLFPQGDIGELSNTMQLVNTGVDAINSGEVHPPNLQLVIAKLFLMFVAASGGGSLSTTATGGQIVFNQKMVPSALTKLALLLRTSLPTKVEQVLTGSIGNGQQLLINLSEDSTEIGFEGPNNFRSSIILTNNVARRAIGGFAFEFNQDGALTGTGNLQLTGLNDGSIRSPQNIFDGTSPSANDQDSLPRGPLLGGGGTGRFNNFVRREQSNASTRAASGRAIGNSTIVITVEDTIGLFQTPSGTGQLADLPQPPSRTLGDVTSQQPLSTTLESNALGHGFVESNRLVSIQPQRRVSSVFYGDQTNFRVRTPSGSTFNSSQLPLPPLTQNNQPFPPLPGAGTNADGTVSGASEGGEVKTSPSAEQNKEVVLEKYNEFMAGEMKRHQTHINDLKDKYALIKYDIHPDITSEPGFNNLDKDVQAGLKILNGVYQVKLKEAVYIKKNERLTNMAEADFKAKKSKSTVASNLSEKLKRRSGFKNQETALKSIIGHAETLALENETSKQDCLWEPNRELRSVIGFNKGDSPELNPIYKAVMAGELPVKDLESIKDERVKSKLLLISAYNQSVIKAFETSNSQIESITFGDLPAMKSLFEPELRNALTEDMKLSALADIAIQDLAIKKTKQFAQDHITDLVSRSRDETLFAGSEPLIELENYYKSIKLLTEESVQPDITAPGLLKVADLSKKLKDELKMSPFYPVDDSEGDTLNGLITKIQNECKMQLLKASYIDFFKSEIDSAESNEDLTKVETKLVNFLKQLNQIFVRIALSSVVGKEMTIEDQHSLATSPDSAAFQPKGSPKTKDPPQTKVVDSIKQQVDKLIADKKADINDAEIHNSVVSLFNKAERTAARKEAETEKRMAKKTVNNASATNIQSELRQIQQNRLSTVMPVGLILVSSEMTSLTRSNEIIITDSGMPNSIKITFNGRSLKLDLIEIATYLGLDGPTNVLMFLDGLKNSVSLVGKNNKGFLTSFKSLVVNGQLNLLDEGTNASMVSKGVINDRLNFVVALLSAFGMLPGVENQRELESWFQSIMMSEGDRMQLPPPVTYSVEVEAQPAYFKYPLVNYDGRNSLQNFLLIGANIGGVFGRLPLTYLGTRQPILRSILRGGGGLSNSIFNQVPRVYFPPPPPSTGVDRLGFGESNRFASIQPQRGASSIFHRDLTNFSVRTPSGSTFNSSEFPPPPPLSSVNALGDGSASNTNEARRSASPQPLVHENDLPTIRQAQPSAEANTAAERPSSGIMTRIIDCINKGTNYSGFLNEFLAAEPSNEHLQNLGSVSENLINNGHYDSFVSVFKHVLSLPNSPKLQKGRDDFNRSVAETLALFPKHIIPLNELGIQFKLSMFRHLFKFYKREDISNVNNYVQHFNLLLENGVIPDDICFDGDKDSLMATSIKYKSSSLLKTLFDLPKNIDLEYEVTNSAPADVEEEVVVVNQPTHNLGEPQSYAVEFHNKTQVGLVDSFIDGASAALKQGLRKGIETTANELYTGQRDSLKATLSFDERQKVYTLSIPNTLDRDSGGSSITFKRLPFDILKELINGQPLQMVNVALAILNSPESFDILDSANLGALFGGLNQTDVDLLKGNIPDSEIDLTQLGELISKIYSDHTKAVSVSVTGAGFDDQDIIADLNEGQSPEATNALACVSSLLKMKYGAIIKRGDHLLKAAERLKEDDKAKILTRLGIQTSGSFNELIKKSLDKLIAENEFKGVNKILTEIRKALKESQEKTLAESKENLTELFSNKAANDAKQSRGTKVVSSFDKGDDEDPGGDGSSSSGGANQFGGNSFRPVDSKNTGSGKMGASIGSGSHAGDGPDYKSHGSYDLSSSNAAETSKHHIDSFLKGTLDPKNPETTDSESLQTNSRVSFVSSNLNSSISLSESDVSTKDGQASVEQREKRLPLKFSKEALQRLSKVESMQHHTNKSAKTQSHSALNSSISSSSLSDVSTKDGEAGESQHVPELKKTRRRIELSEKSRERVKQFLKNKETRINQFEETQRGSGSPPNPMSHTVFYEDYDKPLKKSDVMNGAKILISEQLELLKEKRIFAAVQVPINLLTKLVRNERVTLQGVASCMGLLKNEYESNSKADYSDIFVRCHQILTDLYNFFDSQRTKESSSKWSFGAPLATKSVNDPQPKKLVSKRSNPKEAREGDFKAILKSKLQILQESQNKTKDLRGFKTFLRIKVAQEQPLKDLKKTSKASKKEASSSLTAEQWSIDEIIEEVNTVLDGIEVGQEKRDQYIKKIDDVIGLIDRYESSNNELQFKLPTSESPQNKPTGPGSGSSSVNSSLKSDFSTENTTQQKIIAEVEAFLGDFEKKMSIFLKGEIWNQQDVNNLKDELAIGISKFNPRTINLLTNSGTIGPDLKLKSDECQKRVAYLKLRLELMLIPENDFKGELHLGPISSYIDFLKGLESKLDEEINMADKQTLTEELSLKIGMINKLKPRGLPVEKELIPQSLNSLIEKLQARAKTIKEKLEAKNSSSY